MSELSKLTAAPRADILPGYEFSPFTLGMFGQAEEEFEQRHLRAAWRATEDAPDAIRDAAMRLALEDILLAKLAHGSLGFDRRVKAQSNLPYLLWLCLKPRHPDLIPRDAAKLITPTTEWAIYWGVLECMGYRRDPSKKEEGEARPPTPPDPEPGASSSPPSPSEESLQPMLQI